jgi:hypothetical protein
MFLLIGTAWSCNSSVDSKNASSDSTNAGGTLSEATVYYGGDILTMEGDSASYVEALVVKDGKILYTGGKDDAMKQAGEGHKMIDLQGKTLLPGFIDAHGHIFNAGFQALAADLLPPPDGKGKDMATIVELAKEWQAKNKTIVDKVGWIIGFGYDDAQLAEKRHPDANDLDKVSTDLPVLFIHQSGHLGAMNHKGLELAGYKDGVADPKGGVIRRIKGTKKPSGTLEEMGMFIPLFGILGKVDSKGNEALVNAGIEAYTRFGFTTAQEGRATKAACETYKKMAADNALSIDIVAYPDIQAEMEYMKANGTQKNYTNHFRIGGVKLSLDGSPQGKTAWLTKPFKVPPPGQKADYKGYPAIPDEKTAIGYVETAFENNWQILTHCNGDAAGDQYIKAVRSAATKFGNNDRRSVMIHAQTVREDQLDSMKVLGIIPSFFSMHTFYWGDWHRDETLGKERAYRISPTQSALKRGMIFTEHHDAPVANPDAIRILATTVNRTSRSGDVIGPDQRVSPYIALKSITDWAAYQSFEDDIKGTLKAGKLADFVILDKNPCKIDPAAINDLKVLETIKEGKTVYKRN